jgi:hypothetical protein
MKRTIWRSISVLTLCALLVLTGCTGFLKPAENNDNEQILAELNAMKQQVEATKSEIETIKNSEKQDNTATSVTPTVTPEPVTVEVEVPVDSVFGIDCTVNGGDSVKLDGQTQVHAVANRKDGYEFDHWEFGTETDYESGPDAMFFFSEATVLVAVYHVHKVVTFKNCHMNFMNSNGKAGGKDLTEFDFEEDYVNPETKENCKGGEIDFFVTADVPQGREVDYWLINGVKYQAPNNASKFRVRGQTQATVYEVVLRKKGRTPLG